MTYRAADAAERKKKMREEKNEICRDKGLRELLVEEDGMGTVEMILLIVVLAGLAIIFKNQITAIVTSLFVKISAQTGKI